MAGIFSTVTSMGRLYHTIDEVSYWSGKAFAWLIVGLTFVVSIEVFKRYILNAPTAWIFDLNNMLYGTLFMMCGAYTLALAAHVRADFVYIYMKPRGQAALDLALYFLFFLPGIIGLIYAGYGYAADPWRIGEHSGVTAEGPPLYYFKTVIPIAGALVMLQGLAEIMRCIECLRTGAWPARLEDVEEIDLIVQRTYGVMTNDTLLSIPLFVYMGYIMERAALIDQMFHSVQVAFRRVPASLAVTTMLVCAFWGIASGIVGAVVILVGVIAMRPMLNAGYDVRLASGAITAGGTLGILIPPSVMLIVYAAVAGQSIVKLYAAAMIPGFFLTFLYLVYILGWAIINPKIAPKLREDQYRLTVPDYIKRLERGRSKRVVSGLIAAAFRPSLVRGATAADGRPFHYGLIVKDVLSAAVPVALTVATFGATWWYVLIYNAPAVTTAAVSASPGVAAPLAPSSGTAPATTQSEAPQEVKPQELGEAESEVQGTEAQRSADAPPEEFGSVTERGVAGAGKVPAHFFEWFWGLAAFSALVLAYYFWRMDGEGLEILKELVVSVVALGVHTDGGLPV